MELDRTVRPYILALGLIFAVSFAAGTVAPPSVRKEATGAFQLVADSYQGLPGGTLFFLILFHNVTASLLILASGVLVGVVPVLAIGSNGFFLGVLYQEAARVAGVSSTALRVLPHGVFEIPALLISASYGLWLGVMVVRRMRGREHAPLGAHMKHAFRRYFAVVFPLLVVAGAVETALIVY
jgi:stage II sporulation protein M